MKVTDILNEAYQSYEADNAEANEYADQNKGRYRKLFRDFYKRGEMFVYDTDDHAPTQDPMTTKPAEDTRQSAGYRGKQVTQRRAGLPYDKEMFD
jgi:hypothetical protein